MSSPSGALSLIARELALDAVLGLYTIGLAVHIPGVSNKLPDDLSRMWAPEPHAFPAELIGIPEVVAPDRTGAFWKTTGSGSKRGGARSKVPPYNYVS